MAITLDTAPYIISPAYNGVDWVLDSNTADLLSLRVDVYFDGVYESTIDVPPRLGTTDKFDVRVGSIAKRMLSPMLDTVAAVGSFSITDAPEAHTGVQIKVFEVYLLAGVITTAWNETQTGTPDYTSTTPQAVRMALNGVEALSDYSVTGVNQARLLTMRPLNSFVYQDQPLQLDFVSELNSLEFRVIEIDSSGGTLNDTTTATYDNSSKYRGRFFIDVAGLDADTAKFTVVMRFSGVDRSQTYTFNVVRGICTHKVLYWDNHIGGYDCHYFDAGLSATTKSNASQMIPVSTGLRTNISGVQDEEISVFSSMHSNDMFRMIAESSLNRAEAYEFDVKTRVFRPIIIQPSSGTKKYRDTRKHVNELKVSYVYAKRSQSLRG
tara:strand:+ start:5227 stop:6366 length:1140 start_codon:yes stop_codon:yes gene_type:complete